MVLVAVLMLSFVTTSLSVDCPPLKSIPDIRRRSSDYVLASGESPINDRELVEGWYGDPKYVLASSAPGFFKCGGWYPVWIKSRNGNRAVLCVQSGTDECSQTFEINVMICEETEVYELTEAPVHRASYCFDKNPKVPPEVNITSTVIVSQEHDEFRSRYLFHCSFEKPDDNLFYKTFWYVNGEPKYECDSMQWTDDSTDYINGAALTEDILREIGITKAGFNLQCTVRAQTTLQGALTKATLSENLYFGVTVQGFDGLAIEEGQSHQLYARLDIPFGCGSFLPSMGQECVFNIEVVTVQNQHDCSQAAVIERSCNIQGLKEGVWSDITVTGKITSSLGVTSGLSHLNLKTPKDHGPLSLLWHDYEICNLPVQIVKNTSVIKWKDCHSQNDPYERTFDGRTYYLNAAGVFLLYRDNDGIEVQIETEDCGEEAHVVYGPFCTCGVAVRAGKTVFEISHCRSLVWHIGFSACGDAGEVMQVAKDWNTYTISLPSGLTVKVILQTFRETHLVNVYVYPSVRDIGKGRGMCGVLSSTQEDDLQLQGGGLTDDTHIFAESWRVKDNRKNLFSQDFIDLASYKPVHQYCTCASGDSHEKFLTCSAMAATEVCKKPRNHKIVSPKDCVISKRKKRMAPSYKRYSRSAARDVNKWNKTLAADYCQSQFDKSNTVKVVKDVPGVDISGLMQNCVDDILKSGTTDFTEIAVSSVRLQAMHQAMVNPELGNRDPSTPMAQSVFEQITENTCLSDCSGEGICKDGICHCNLGFGGEDCSVDLATPPVLHDVGDYHCDLSVSSCVSTSVLGNVFSGREDATCRIEKLTVRPNGDMETRIVHTAPAVAESISEVECPIPEVEDDDVVVMYQISVSQSGETFSNKLPIIVYDYSCVSVNHNTNVWTKRSDNCMHKGQCASIGDLRRNDPCQRCEYSNEVASWVVKNGDGCADGSLHVSSSSSGPTPTVLVAAVFAMMSIVASL